MSHDAEVKASVAKARRLPIVAGVFAAIAVCGALGGCLGAINVVADWLNQFTPVWLFIGLAAAAAFACLGRQYWFVSALVALTLAATSGALLTASAGDAVRPGRPMVRIVQFNVLKDNRDPDRALKWIEAQSPDIIVLEEAAKTGARIREGLAVDYPYSIDCLGKRHKCSTVVLSRRPATASGGLARGDPENRKALSAVWATFDTRAGPLTLTGVHLSRPWPYGDQSPAVDQLLAHLRRTDRSRLVMVGDFNQTPWTHAAARLEMRAGLKRVRDAGATWPSGRLKFLERYSVPTPLLLPLDHVFVGSRWRATGLRRGPDLGSDHRPLVIDLAPL